MWIWKNIAGVTWVNSLKNVEVLTRLGEERTALEMIRKKNYCLGHEEDDSLLGIRDCLMTSEIQNDKRKERERKEEDPIDR